MSCPAPLRALVPVLVLAAAFGVVSRAAAAVHTVTCGAGAASQLTNLVDTAVPGDSILIPACTIALAAPLVVTGANSPLAIAGAGAGRTALDGGGVTRVVLVQGGTLSLAGLTIRNGSAPSSSGGGILVDGGSLTLVNSVVSGNQANQGGGVNSFGSLTVLDSTFRGNTATIIGGAIASVGGGAQDAPLTLVGVTISGNTAANRGGGVFISNATTAVTSTTIAGNTAGLVGGGLANQFSTRPQTLRNTIVADNTAPADANCVTDSAAFTSLGHNLDSGSSCNFGGPGDLSNLSAGLGPLQNNGGATPPHALLAGSPAIDAGDQIACPATDQRGVPTPQDGNGDGVAVCDIGAVEARATGILVSTGTGSGGGPHVRLFRLDGAGAATELGGFFAYDPGFLGGVQATLQRVGDDLFVVTGVGSGGGPHVRLFRVTDLATGSTAPVGTGFFAYDPGFTGGVRVATAVDDTGHFLIVTGTGAGGAAHVRLFQVTDAAAGTVVPLGGGFFAYDPAFVGGVNVGAE
jgi:hypothetical protein